MSKGISEMKGAIVHKVRWVSPKSGKFKNYIKYIDRDEATRNYKFEEFSLYNDYMGNPKKSGSLFTNAKDFMNRKEIRELKNKFELAQKNKSMMWQDVFSFRNEWLIENGYLNPKTNVLDERKIRDAIRKSMSELTKDKGENELIWSASIHYNTKHIHIHVASVELKPNEKELKLPTKERGKRKLSSLKTMKSKFINEMRNRDEFYKELDVLARDNMIGSKKEYDFMKDSLLREKMLDLLKYMPKSKRDWNYERTKEARPYLNAITKYYLETFCKDDYKRFKELLERDKEEQIKIYGIPKDTRKLYQEHYKEKDLYKRMGNTIIKELKDFVKEEEYKNKRIECLNDKNKFKRSKKHKYKNKNIVKNETLNYTKKEFSKDKSNKEDIAKENIKSQKDYKEDDIKKNILSENKIEKNIINNLDKEFKTQKNYNNINLTRALNNIKRGMRNDLEHYLNMREFERMELQKDYENGLSL